MHPAQFSLILDECADDRLVIRDTGHTRGCLTVTNNAEEVVTYLYGAALIPNHRALYYYDSEGALSQILHKDGKFLGFAEAT